MPMSELDKLLRLVTVAAKAAHLSETPTLTDPDKFDLLQGIALAGVVILPGTHTVQLLDTTVRDMPGWEVHTRITIHATQWEPADEDLKLIGTEPTVWGVAKKAVLLLLEDQIDGALESESYAIAHEEGLEYAD